MSHSAEVFRAFLKLGVTSFGGPVAHLGYFREELVAKRKWVSEQQYSELVAICQFLPGPASSQVGFALGLIRGGYLGALAAWTAFTLPSAILLVLFAIGAVTLDGAIGAGVISGLTAVAVAVVAHAVWGMARTLTPDLRRIGIAIVAALLALLLPGAIGQVAAIGVGILAGVAWCRRVDQPEATPLQIGVSRRAGVVALTFWMLLLVLLPIAAATTRSPGVSLIDAFYRSGALVFGGGHVVLPLLAAEPAIANAVTPEQILAGYGAAQAVPGPLFTFASFLGFEMGVGGSAPLTALIALIAIFLPGMLLLLAVLPFWSQVRGKPVMRAAIAGANAAVVGILAAALWNPVVTSGITSPATLVIAGVGLVLLFAARFPAWAVVLTGVVAGALSGATGFGLFW
ncbi:chromate efflux transporter [Leucobacter denitrificans]|uniref:Chromate efflux transporter n=1 Tax=Leucobacter denitrificans TaxID=683042 RepID=A0A7G9S2Q7_9MICO|nr:chromate efflux transporter [Leucobacter denitrificans]QNN62132.1 chromate efflux transporter [Leucobacter denitrificans]